MKTLARSQTLQNYGVYFQLACVYAACSSAVCCLYVTLGCGCFLEVGFVLGVWLLSCF